MFQDWKIEYGANLFEGDFKKATEIKNENINRNFFKYRCFDTDERWIEWIKGRIFFNTPSIFNDPFDCLINVAPETRRMQVVDASKELLGQRVKLNRLDIMKLEVSNNPVETIQTIFKQHDITVGRNEHYEAILRDYMNNRTDQRLRGKIRLSCFSETNNSILMWSHYTKNHQGFCVEYDFSAKNSIIDCLYPVFYSEKKFVLLPQHSKAIKPIWPVLAILCKAIEWEYELEWRCIDKTSFNSIALDCETTLGSIFVPDTMKAVYLGVEAVKYNIESVEKLKKLLFGRNIKLFKMQFDDIAYKLTPTLLD